MDIQKAKAMWDKMGQSSLGRKAFSFILSKGIPYTGSVSPEIVSLESGTAVVRIKDRRALRNHLKSVHAIALANVGELSTGLAALSRMPPGMRYIVTDLRIQYFKKARGVIEATATCPEISAEHDGDLQVTSELRDVSKDIVAKITAIWKVGPRPTQTTGANNV